MRNLSFYFFEIVLIVLLIYHSFINPKMMKNALPIGQTRVPEWEQIYFQSGTLLSLIETLYDMGDIESKLRILISSTSPLGDHNKTKQYKQYLFINLKKHMDLINYCFFELYHAEKRIVQNFVQMKSQELTRNSKLYSKILFPSPKYGNIGFVLIENTYIENEFLQQLMKISSKEQRKIINDHHTIAKRYIQLDSLDLNQRKISRIEPLIKRISETMEAKYVQIKSIEIKEAKNTLKTISRRIIRSHTNRELIFQFIVGFMLFTLMYLLYLVETYDIHIESNETFKNTFPLWRGLTYFIAYIWVLAIDLFVFERFKINYRRVMNLDNNKMPKSFYLFFSACFFSIIYMALFIMFMLKLVDFYDFGSFDLYEFPATGWMIVLGMTIFPFGNNYYFLKMVLLMFLSPIIGVTFTSNWLSEQLTSFKQPFHDVSYTLIFYLAFQDETTEEDTRYSGAWIGTSIFVLRILQGIRKGIEIKKYFRGTPLFRGCIKCILNIITIWTAYLYRVEDEDPTYLIAWLVSGSASTLYAFAFDIFFDWNLISYGENGFQMRQKLIFGPKRLYVFFIVINLVLRVAWLFTISSDFVATVFTYPYLFIFVVSLLQICRRGLWNAIFIQKQHARNCQNFQFMVNHDDYRDQAIRIYCQEKNQTKQNLMQAQQLKKRKQLELNGIKTLVKVKMRHQKTAKELMMNSQSIIDEIRKIIKKY